MGLSLSNFSMQKSYFLFASLLNSCEFEIQNNSISSLNFLIKIILTVEFRLLFNVKKEILKFILKICNCGLS